MRRYLPGVSIALALGFAGFWSVCHGYRALRMVTMVNALDGGTPLPLPGFLRERIDSATGPVKDYPAAWALTRSYGKDEFPRTAEAFRDLARRHPAVERADLWRWWRNGSSTLRLRARFEEPYPAEPPDAPSGLRPTEEELRATPEEEAWDEAVAFLRERDPDNGWPLILMAYRELMLGTRLYVVQAPYFRYKDQTHGVNRYEVLSPVHAARAARLVHEAVRKPRFDCAMDETQRMEFERRGGRPETLAGTVNQIGALNGWLSPGLDRFRETARRLAGEAERVARLPGGADDPDSLSAFEILYDLQTMAARLMTSGTSMVDGLVGTAIMHIASGEGDRVLREAGREDEAGRLVIRGRRLIRPWLVVYARDYHLDRRGPGYSGYQARERSILLDDPALLAEGEAALAAADNRERRGPENPMSHHNIGLLSGMMLPPLGRLPWTAEAMPTLDEMRDSRRFEFYGLYGMVLGLAILPLLGLGLALFLGGYALVYLTPVRGSGPETPPWPGAGWVVLASVAAAGLSFGLFWALCYGWAEPLLRLPFRRVPLRWEWNGFWLAWTILAGWHGLAWMAARGARKALPEALRATAGPRWWEKTATVASWLGLGLASTLYLLGYGLDWRKGDVAIILAFVALLLPVAGVCLQWVGGMAGGSDGAYARGRGRYLLTGLAGWILLWGCFALYVGEREKELARCERVVVPDVVDGEFVAVNVPEGEIVKWTREHVGRMLREEALAGPVSER